jgi:hypothetical protein
MNNACRLCLGFLFGSGRCICSRAIRSFFICFNIVQAKKKITEKFEILRVYYMHTIYSTEKTSDSFALVATRAYVTAPASIRAIGDALAR